MENLSHVRILSAVDALVLSVAAVAFVVFEALPVFNILPFLTTISTGPKSSLPLDAAASVVFLLPVVGIILTAKLRAPALYGLAISVVVLNLWWYPLELLGAIARFDLASGAFIDSSGHSIFIFTIGAAALSFVLMFRWIKRAGGRWWVAAGVAYAATIGVTMWYQQVFVTLFDLQIRSSYYFGFYWLSPIHAFAAVFNMAVVFMAFPWFRRQNAKPVALMVAVTLACFAAWFITGYGYPTSSPFAYAMNGGSMIGSQLAMAFAIRPGGDR